MSQPAEAPPRAAEIIALADALRPALLRISRRLRLESQAGLSAQDAVLLGRVKASPGIGVSGLAEVEQTSRPTMSGHLKRLEETGLIARADDVQDGRRSGFTITPAGRRKLDQIRAQRNDWLARRLARLAPADRERVAQAVAPLLELAGAEP